MAYYLIDFENVKSRGMEGVELLAEEDTVCIFYSDNADSMTFDLHRKLNETKAQIIYHKVAVGTKNALDFQLATYLGYLICEQQREGIHPDYFIVTKDNGFTSLMVYWKAQGVPVRITRNLVGKEPDSGTESCGRRKCGGNNGKRGTGECAESAVGRSRADGSGNHRTGDRERNSGNDGGTEGGSGCRGDCRASICERADTGRTVA